METVLIVLLVVFLLGGGGWGYPVGVAKFGNGSTARTQHQEGTENWRSKSLYGLNDLAAAS